MSMGVEFGAEIKLVLLDDYVVFGIEIMCLKLGVGSGTITHSKKLLKNVKD